MYFYWGLQKENGNIPKFHTGYGKIDLKSRENLKENRYSQHEVLQGKHS